MNISGAIVHHTYQTSGKKTVHVTAKNQVEKLERNIIVFVNYEIQGENFTVIVNGMIEVQ